MSGRPRSLAPNLALLREQRYRRHFLREDGRQTTIVVGVIGVAYAAASVNDFGVLHGWLLVASLTGRALLFAVAVILFLLLRRARWPRQQDRASNFAIGAIAIVLPLLHLSRLATGKIQGVLIGTGALLTILYFAQRGRLAPRMALGGALALTAIVLLYHPRVTIEPPARLAGVLSLVALNFIGAFSARAFEENRRKRFAAERGERHMRQELAAKLRELAVEKERAEAMSRARAAFLAAMSHELRTPMNAVIGLSELLLDARLEAEHAAHVRTISESARALLALLNDVLDFAKIDARKLTLSPAAFELRHLAESVIEMLRPAARARSLELTLDLAPALPRHLLGDEARLRQVLVNLVSNAIKFTESGAVTLRITDCAYPVASSPQAAAEPGAPPAPAASEHDITCRVEDTGIGMEPEVIERLFRPFEQADKGIARRYGGTGLGLAISRQIILAMGGDIHVESEPGRGSVFSFTIRLATAAPPPPALALTNPEERPPLAILVVDDHPINRDVARVRLGRLGYRVDLASDGQAAIEAVTKKDYDVVFMDVQMPGMSGIEATRRIGERLAGKAAPHIVAMTASVFEEDREACRRAGMRDFVGKPIDLAQLDAVLGRVAEERGATKERAMKSAPQAAAPQAAAPQAAAPLAALPLAELRKLEALGEPDFFANLCRVYMADAEARLARMGDALGRGDARAMEEDAHALKSASAALGAIGMAELCSTVERAARAGQIGGLPGALAALSEQYREVERALQQEIQGGAVALAAPA